MQHGPNLASPRQMGWSGCRDARSCVSTKAHPEKRIIAGDLASHSRYVAIAGFLQYQAHSAETQDLTSPRQMGWSGCRDAKSCVSTKAHPEKRIIAGDLASHARYRVLRHLGRIMSRLQGLYNIRLIAQRRKILHLRGRWDGPVVETQDLASLPRRIPKNASLQAILRLIRVTLYCDI